MQSATEIQSRRPSFAAAECMIGGYTREAGVWRLAAVLGEVCAKVVWWRSEGDTAAVEVAPEQLAGMLGAPRHRAADVAGRRAAGGPEASPHRSRRKLRRRTTPDASRNASCSVYRTLGSWGGSWGRGRSEDRLSHDSGVDLPQHGASGFRVHVAACCRVRAGHGSLRQHSGPTGDGRGRG